MAETFLGLLEQLPLSFLDPTPADLTEMRGHFETFPAEIHDSLIESNHLVCETDVITTDDSIIRRHYQTVWA